VKCTKFKYKTRIAVRSKLTVGRRGHGDAVGSDLEPDVKRAILEQLYEAGRLAPAAN